jgi:uncharacterized membrane protein
MLKILAFVFTAEIFIASGHIFMKKATNSLDQHGLRDLKSYLRFLGKVLGKPVLWLGLLTMVVGLSFWLLALSAGALSVVYSLGSLQYVLILVMAHIFLGEKIDMMKLLGTFLVVFGIILITLS